MNYDDALELAKALEEMWGNVAVYLRMQFEAHGDKRQAVERTRAELHRIVERNQHWVDVLAGDTEHAKPYAHSIRVARIILATLDAPQKEER